MAATTYSTGPSNTYVGLPTQLDRYRGGSHETYGSNIESLTAHPYQSSYGNIIPDHQQQLHRPTPGYPTQPQPHMPPNPSYSTQPQQHMPPNPGYSTQPKLHIPPYPGFSTQSQQHMPPNPYEQQSDGFSNSHIPNKNLDRPIATNSNHDTNHMPISTTQTTNMKNKESLPIAIPIATKNPQKNSYPGVTQPRPQVPVDKQQDSVESNLVRSERQISNYPPKQQPVAPNRKPAPPPNPPQLNLEISARLSSPPTARQRSLSNHNHSHTSEPVSKPNPLPREQKLNKSSVMRAAAIKKLEENREQKRNNAFFPTTKNKAISNKEKPPPTSPETDYDQKETRNVQRKKKTSHSHSQDQRRQTDGEQSETEKIKPKKQQPHSVPKSRKAHPQTDGEQSEAEQTKRKKKPLASQSQDLNHRTDGEQSETEKSKSNKKKAHPVPKSRRTNIQTDDEQSETEKSKSNKKKSHPVPKSRKTNVQTDDEQSDVEKSKANKKKSHPKPKQHKSRHDDHQTDHNNTSDEDDENHRHRRSKSQKRTKFPDPRDEKQPHLPPIHRARAPPHHHDSRIDGPLPPGHPMRGPQPYYDEYPPYGPYPGGRNYRPRHLYEDAYNVPPYLAPYHDAYDPFFDYEKRKTQPKHRKEKNASRTDHEDNGAATGNETDREEGSKSQQSRKSRNKNHHEKQTGRKSRPDNEDNRRSHAPPHPYYPEDIYDGNDPLDLWRQERNDYLKKKFKPSVHDVLYSQQWMKADSYLENQRRRHLRDSQGYYFPYKKYTLKDYKDLQKADTQNNPFADLNEPLIIDRKERARKRHEYGLQVERQAADNPGIRQIIPREMSPRKPWHLSNVETVDPELATKRERALEYAKVQVKYRPINKSKHVSNEPDSVVPYDHSYSPAMNDEPDESSNERRTRANKSYDDYEE